MHVADKIGPTLAGLEISSLRSEVSSWCSPASSATTVSQLFDDGSNDGRMASQRRDGELPRWRSRGCSVLRADVLSGSWPTTFVSMRARWLATWSPRLPTNDACTFVGYRKWLRVRLRLRPAGQAFIKRDPKGKTIDYILCGAPRCTAGAALMTKIDDTLGWKTNTIANDGTPKGLTNAWAQVLRQQPDGIAFVALPRSSMNADLLHAKADHIPVVDATTTDPPGNGITYIYGDTRSGKTGYSVYGSVMADWVVAHSNGHPSALFVNLPDFPVITDTQQVFKSSYARDCPGCSQGSIDIPEADIGTTAPGVIVSYFRAHPDTKYVVLGTDALGVGLPAAIKAAGITGINIFGQSPTTTNFQYIADGEERGTIGGDVPQLVYSQVDSLARTFAGVPQQPSGAPPIWIIDKTKIPNFSSDPIYTDSGGAIYTESRGVAAYFDKLWGIK